MAGIDAAAVTALATALAVARGGSTPNTGEQNVAQAMADLVLKAIVNPTNMKDAELRPITGTGDLS